MEKKRKHNFVDRTGERHINKEGCWGEIIEYVSNRSCTVKFDNGFVAYNRQYGDVTRGRIKNLLFKSVYGVGYEGIGKYKISNGGIHTREYARWHGMLTRAYDPLYHARFPTYKDVTVCEEWHCFQNFAEWFEDNYNPEIMEDWALDKDVLCKDCKVYSPSNCDFIPPEINGMLTSSKATRGECLIGVTLVNGRYAARCNVNGITEPFGTYDTELEAFYAYKAAKEAEIKRVANKYRGQITERMYVALMNYEVKVTD